MLADLIRILHLAFFAFVVGGFGAFLVGALRREPWTRNPWFRATHFAAVALVLVEDTFQLSCPLNVLEDQAVAAQSMSASESLFNTLLHHTISEQALDVIYWTLGAVLIAMFFLVPPRKFRST